MSMRLVIGPERREAAEEAAMEAAFAANDSKEISYTTEKLIKAGVSAAIDKLETMLA